MGVLRKIVKKCDFNREGNFFVLEISEKYVLANRGGNGKIEKNLTNRPKQRTIFFGWENLGKYVII